MALPLFATGDFPAEREARQEGFPQFSIYIFF